MGIAALTGVVTSEALYSSSTFDQQAPIVVSALLTNLQDVDIGILESE